jgi:MFS family permease
VRSRGLTVALVVIAFAQLMVVLDTTIVNVALPSIQRSLRFAPTDLEWVVNAYAPAFGGLLLLGGRAVLGTIAANVTRGQLMTARPTPETIDRALIAGFASAFEVGALVSLAGSLLAPVVIRGRPLAAADEAPRQAAQAPRVGHWLIAWCAGSGSLHTAARAQASLHHGEMSGGWRARRPGHGG